MPTYVHGDQQYPQTTSMRAMLCTSMHRRSAVAIGNLWSVGSSYKQHPSLSTAGVAALHLHQHLSLQSPASLMLSCTAPSLLLSWVKILNKVSASSLRHANESPLTTEASEPMSQLVRENLIVLMSQKPWGETTNILQGGCQ